MGMPVGGGAAGSKGVLQSAVEPLYQPVGLGVVGGCGAVADVEEAAESGPQRGGKLSASVAGDGLGDTKALDPSREEGRCALRRRRPRQRHRLWPPAGTVYNSKKVCIRT